MGGIQGRLGRQFAVTIAISVIISAFNALTLSPALAAMLLRPRKRTAGPLGRFFAAFNRLFTRATDRYVTVSGLLIRRTALGLALLAVFVAASAAMGRQLPTSFVPEEDYGYFTINLQLPPAASLQRTDEVARKIERVLLATEGVASFNATIGFSFYNRVTASNYGLFFAGLEPWAERRRPDLSARAIVDRVNAEIRRVAPEATAFAAMPPSIPGLGSVGGFSIWLQDRGGGSIDLLDASLQKFLAAARQRPEVTGVTSTFSASVPQIFVDVDRDKVLKQGVPLPEVYQTLQAYLGGVYINQFNRFGRQWRVFLQAEPEERASPADLSGFYVRNNDGDMVPLSTLQRTREIAGPQYTNRFNVYRAVQVTGGAAPGYSSGDALDAIEEVARTTLPPEFGFDYSDLSYQERRATQETWPVFVLSVVFVFLILAALYESWSLPFSVLLSVPVAVFGAFAGLLLRRMDFDVYAQIGVIMLIGLAAKNAILIVEFAKLRLERGGELAAAALEGARLRLRPIVMTSFAFILGCVPLWAASGSGAASRRILGTVVITGMLAATLIAVFLIPMLFVIVERVRGHKAEAAQGAAVALSDGSAP
jgi:HAE1 family hydrophobic/amphiphilic exporter-1